MTANNAVVSDAGAAALRAFYNADVSVSMVRTLCQVFLAMALASSSLGMATDARKRAGSIVNDVGSIPVEALPKGWRFPNQAELRDRGERAVQISADFNGDGVHDEAILLKSEKSPAEGLWVWLSGSNRTRQWINLDTRPSQPNVPLTMDIEAVPPGTYAHGCFEFVKGCNPGAQRPKLAFHNFAIVYYGAGTASTYVWTKKDNRFQRVWSSD
jgi:hypothetical protein